jgi:hypothetical protein
MKLKNGGLKVDSSIFETFNKLTSEDENVRIKGASGLVKILEETSEDKVSRKKMCTSKGFDKIVRFLVAEAVGLRYQTTGSWKWIIDIKLPHRIPHCSHRSSQCTT